MPTVIVPYRWPITEPSREDLFVYLRPETNGVRVESLLLGTVRNDPRYRDRITIAYLANIPGEFIAARRVLEEHYVDRLYFARRGKEAFTPEMLRRFADFFGVDPERAEVVGAFEAMRRMGWSSEELFRTRVAPVDLCTICAQTIKRVGDLYVVNADIPAILRKNGRGADIAVMIFRSNLDAGELPALLETVRRNLVEGGVLSSATPLTHAMHCSKSPFEQILDASGYLYDPRGNRYSLEDIRYSRWLIDRSVPVEIIRGALSHPIFLFEEASGERHEEHLFVHTAGDSYEEAYDKFRRGRAQLLQRVPRFVYQGGRRPRG